LTDPKTWLFALFAAFDNVPNSLTNQIQIIVSSFGYTPFQTTLLGCVGGVVEIVTIFTGVTLASRIPNSRAWVGIAYIVPNVLGALLVNLLPWHDKVGLLFSFWLSGKRDFLRICIMHAHRTLVIRHRNYCLCLSPGMGIANDGRAYKESHDKRCHAICILHR
jgi:hypothetical protein